MNWNLLKGCRTLLAAATVALLMAGCGGGDGGGGSPGTTAILDSFGQPIGSDAGIGDGDSGADGTAGEGKPIVGGTVTVTDSTGKTATATTDAQGYYRLKVTGFTAPFVAKVAAPGGKVYHSLNVQAIKVNGFITINISGLTDKIASDVAKAGGKAGASELTPAIVAANTSAITASLQALRTQLDAVIRDAGINPSTFDPIGVPFRADHTGYDKVLDNVVVVVGSDGSTQVAVSPTFPGNGNTGGTLTGTWELSIEEDGETIAAGQFPAAAVPSEQVLAALTTEQLLGPVLALDVAAGKTVTVNGNTIHLTGPNTDFTVTIQSMSIGQYQGCGDCGVGSTVQFALSFTSIEGGTTDGEVVPPGSTFSDTIVFRYKRIN